MYTLNLHTGNVTRNSDGLVVAPAQSIDAPLYVEYVAWVNAGNTPTQYTPPVTTTVNVVTRYQFRQLFTLGERIAVDNAQANTAIPANYRAMLLTMSKDLELSAEVQLDNPQVAQGVQLLEALGLIGVGRSARILAALPPL